MYEVRGTASHRNICNAGLHTSEVVIYHEGQGPKLCPSLEQSIAHILSQNSQILEDLEGEEDQNACPPMPFLSKLSSPRSCHQKSGQICDKIEEQKSDLGHNRLSGSQRRQDPSSGQPEGWVTNRVEPATRHMQLGGQHPVPPAIAAWPVPAESHREAPQPATFQIPMAPTSKARLGRKAPPDRQRAGGFVPPRPLQGYITHSGRSAHAAASVELPDFAEPEQGFGPPNVPAGVFQFLGGKKITISSAAQQRAAAMQRALQEIQQEGADEYLDAPCMQLIAPQALKQQQMSSLAAEQGSGTGAHPRSAAQDDRNAQGFQQAHPSEDGESRPQPANPARERTLEQQTAKALADVAGASVEEHAGNCLGENSGPPDVPAGVFQFLGGRQIVISSEAKQRAAALQSELQQIQQADADEDLSAPCMQLIALQPAEQEQAPSSAAEQNPGAVAPLTGNGGLGVSMEACPEPDIAAGHGSLHEQMAEAPADEAQKMSASVEPHVDEEMKQSAGPPDVPPGIFSFLGGKQITISSAAQQRAAGMQAALKQIQLEPADEYLDAPCMQLIASQPAEQEPMPANAAEQVPDTEAIPVHVVLADQQMPSVSPEADGSDHEDNAQCPQLALAAQQGTSREQTARIAGEHAQNTGGQPVSGAVEVVLDTIGRSQDNVAGHEELPNAVPATGEVPDALGHPRQLLPESPCTVTGTAARDQQPEEQNPPSSNEQQRELPEQPVPLQPPVTASFATASGAPVQVSAADLSRAAVLFGDITEQQGQENGASCMFSTGAGKPVHVAADKLDSARKLLAGVEEEHGLGIPVQQVQGDRASCMFSTGTGKPVHVTADKLASAQKFLTSTVEDHGSGRHTSTPTRDQPAGVHEPPQGFSGWETGAGKRVEVDEESLAAARRLMCEDPKKASSNVAHSSVPNVEQGQLQSRVLGDHPSAESPAKKRAKLAVCNENDGAACNTFMSPLVKPALGGGVPASPYTPAGPAAVAAGLEDVIGRGDGLVTPDQVQECPDPATTAAKGAFKKPILSSIKKAPISKSTVRPPPSSGLSRTAGRSTSSFKAPRSKLATPMRRIALKQDMANGTPSRLQNTSMATATRVALHSLEETLAGRLLASVPAGTCMGPQQAMDTVSMAVSELDSVAASDFTVPASQGIGKEGERLGHAEFAELLHAAGAEPQYAVPAWVANHYRWVVWKLACYERQFPNHLAGRMLTASVILDQLKYRYEREFGRGHRSVLKKVLEQDEPPQRPMVLCLAAILQPRPPAGEEGRQTSPGPEQRQVEMTDGWYSVRATLDAGLSRMLAEQKLHVGTKVRVCGSELTAGSPSDVLEASHQCFLHLHFNGCHRVAGATPLGWTANRSVIVPLGAVRPGGGAVPRTCIVVQRCYPPLYRDCTSDGQFLRRTSRAKAAADRALEGGLQQAEEAVAFMVATEEREHCRQIIGDAKEGCSTPKGALTYARALMAEEGLANSARSFSAEDQADHDRYQNMRQQAMQARREEILQAGLPACGVRVERSIRQISFLVSAVIHREACGDVEQASQTRAVIEVSNPDEDLERITEGSAWAVSDLAAPDMHRGTLLLRTTARSHWQRLDLHSSPQILAHAYKARQVVQLQCLAQQQPRNDFDFHGIVLGAGEKQHVGKQVSQWVFVADESCAQGSSILAVHLQAQPEAVDFLDDAKDSNCVITLMNLHMGDYDTTNCLWRAEGNESTAISLQTIKAAASSSKPSSRVQQLASWAQGATPLLSSLRQRVQQLLAC
ncbi:probable breast cancer type 2 susceptibility protein homolog at C-terminar half [Coccomyxa sp. Obi]|nr:probable breast cancer type 2 susceptibility protein homolog at C-terminar half [Coccomyxa sp. Obi]